MKALEPLLLLKSQLIHRNGYQKFTSAKQLDEISNLLQGFIYVFDISSYKVVYINQLAEKLTGLPKESLSKMGVQWPNYFMHPDDHQLASDIIQYFKTNPTSSYTTFYRIKDECEGWRWVYGVFSQMPESNKPSSNFVLCIGFDVSKLNPPHQTFDKYLKETDFFKENCRKFNALTKREKEVLKLLYEQRTNQEIAIEMSISKQTVQTHRKNINKKLEVSNSFGLAQYVRFFEEDRLS